MSAPCASSSSACPTRSTPTTQPNPPARPASTPASASSKTAAWAGPTPSVRRGEERVRRRLAAQVLPRGPRRRRPVLDVSAEAGHVQHLPGVRAGGDHGAAQAGVAGRPRGRPASPRRRGRRRGRWRAAAARSSGCRGRARSARPAGRPASPSGSPMPRDGQERAHAVGARPAVDVPVVVASGSNGTNVSPVRAARSRRYASNISFQAAVVHRRSLGEDAVEVEQAGRHAVGKSQHPHILPARCPVRPPGVPAQEWAGVGGARRAGRPVASGAAGARVRRELRDRESGPTSAPEQGAPGRAPVSEVGREG